MSKDAIQAVLQELETLPETDQRRVLNFLATLKRDRTTTVAGASVVKENSALVIKDNLLVFTGRIDAPNLDWVALTQDDHDESLMQAASV
ncbi:MAG TPA: hypothetical protein VFC44_01785 [Candidatus Saccharimonadales bacterium]|nr:hypothetical protein [Candidatus Saccharimonadales bacterium]